MVGNNKQHVKCLLRKMKQSVIKCRFNKKKEEKRNEIGEVEKLKTNNDARVSEWNEQSITIELGVVFVPRRFRDGDESQPTLRTGSRGCDSATSRGCVALSGGEENFGNWDE